MNTNQLDIDKYFIENAFHWTIDDLKQLTEQMPSTDQLTRYIRALENRAHGIVTFKDDRAGQFYLFFAEYEKEHKCIVLPIPIDDFILAENLLFHYVKFIETISKEIDFVNMFNTFQYHRESAYETLYYNTIRLHEVGYKLEDLVAPKLVPIEFIDRVELLRDMFSYKERLVNDSETNKVYLMVDDQSGFVKIGRSKNPMEREGTLQSKKPEIHLFAIWDAPKNVETQLHRQYAHKRKRGEWFKLNFLELDEIKRLMIDFDM